MSKRSSRPNIPVNPIRIILRLNRNTRALNNLLRRIQSLRRLQPSAPVHPRARVQHDARLVRAQIGLDPRECAPQRQHYGVLGRVVDQPVAVVALADAVGAAVALELGVGLGVPEEEVGLAGEVVDAAWLGG